MVALKLLLILREICYLAGYGVDIIAIRSTKADLASRPKTQAKVTDLLAPNMLKGWLN